jgi:hypothetical protein
MWMSSRDTVGLLGMRGEHGGHVKLWGHSSGRGARGNCDKNQGAKNDVSELLGP